jgi:hypothetical protein
MTDLNEPATKNETPDPSRDLLHHSGEAGGDPDSHLGATRDHQPRAADDEPATTKLQRTAGQDPDNDQVVPEQNSPGVAPS